jgi:hypothetical protein
LFENLSLDNRQHLSFTTEHGPVQVLKYTFSEVNSPLVFRSILTFSSKASFIEATPYETTFWFSEIVESPHNLLSKHQKHPGNFWVNHTAVILKVTDFEMTAEMAAILGATTGLLMLAPEGIGE